MNFQGTYIPDFTSYEGTTLQRDKSTGNTKCQKKKLKNNQEKFLIERIAQVGFTLTVTKQSGSLKPMTLGANQ